MTNRDYLTFKVDFEYRPYKELVKICDEKIENLVLPGERRLVENTETKWLRDGTVFLRSVFVKNSCNPDISSRVDALFVSTKRVIFVMREKNTKKNINAMLNAILKMDEGVASDPFGESHNDLERKRLLKACNYCLAVNGYTLEKKLHAYSPFLPSYIYEGARRHVSDLKKRALKNTSPSSQEKMLKDVEIKESILEFFRKTFSKKTFEYYREVYVYKSTEDGPAIYVSFYRLKILDVYIYVGFEISQTIYHSCFENSYYKSFIDVPANFFQLIYAYAKSLQEPFYSRYYRSNLYVDYRDVEAYVYRATRVTFDNAWLKTAAKPESTYFVEYKLEDG